MASSLHFIFFSLSILCSQVSSRPFEQIPKFSTLDVSAAVQNAKGMLSSSPEEYQTMSDSSSLKLYPRHTLEKSKFSSYSDLILSRLNRDSQRVKYIHNKLGVNPTSEFSAPLSPGAGEYYAEIGFGTPSTKVQTIVDTGSDVTWIQCKPCQSCYKQDGPIFDPSASSSYELVSCSAPECAALSSSSCLKNTCTYQVRYGDGSQTTGDLAKETLQLGTDTIQNIAIGCGHDNEGLFRVAGGLLGLGRGESSFTTQTNTSSFSYCLTDMSSNKLSTLDFGSSDASVADVSTPLLKAAGIDLPDSFYFVGLTGVVVGGKLVPYAASSDSPVIVDSGTSVTRFSTAFYEAVRDEFVKGMSGVPVAGPVSIFDTCYNLQSVSDVKVPTVGFQFGKKVLELPAKNVLLLLDENNTFCFSFATGGDQVSIIGNIQQQGTKVDFDLGNSLIGFSSDKC
ncbi:hypothetical protein ACHQM5_017324 [Ranunculus cassubicifolius]